MLERGKRADSSEELVRDGKAVWIKKQKLMRIILAAVWFNIPPVSQIFGLGRYWENGGSRGYSVEGLVIFTFHMTVLAL